MKKSKLLAIILAALMVLSMFAACGKKETPDAPGEPDTQAAQQQEEKQEEDAEAEEQEEEPVEKGEDQSESSNFSASKLGSFEAASYFTPCKGGMTYQDDEEKYGIVSLDGSHVTEPEYVICKSAGEYFTVSKSIPTDENDFDALNSCGLVDSKGNTVIPMEYASIDILNERYAKVVKVTEITDNKDDALVYYTDSMFSFSPDEDDILFKGTWNIYDLKNNKVLDGISGTKGYTMSAKGDYVSYITDDETRHTVNADGQELNEDATLLENGCYVMRDEGTVYNSDGSKLFDYNTEKHVPNGCEGDYFYASYYVDDGSKYVLMDNKGEVVSAEFDSFITLCGELIECDNVLYDFDGNEICDECEYVYCDKALGQYYLVKKGEEAYTVIDKQGTELASFVTGDDSYISSTDFLANKKIDDGYGYYSYKDKDYTFKSSPASVGTWLVSVDEGDTKAIYDTLSGDKVLDGYNYYSSIETEDGVYVFARQDGSSWDAYIIEAK